MKAGRRWAMVAGAAGLAVAVMLAVTVSDRGDPHRSSTPPVVETRTAPPETPSRERPVPDPGCPPEATAPAQLEDVTTARICIFRPLDDAVQIEADDQLPAFVTTLILAGMAEKSFVVDSARETATLVILSDPSGGVLVARVQPDRTLVWESAGGLRGWPITDRVWNILESYDTVVEETG